MSLVSVTMPVYNAERYVAEAVQSVLAQTHRELELIIVDDGSTDGTLAILQRLAAQDPRIRLSSRANRGISATRNECLAQARGEFIAVLDADDVAMPDRFDRQVQYLRDHPDCLCVGGAIQEIDEQGRELIQTRFPTEDSAIQESALSAGPSLCHSAVLMRREAVERVGGYREEVSSAEDLDLWLRLGERGRLANLPDIVVKYRVHTDSVSATGREEQWRCVKNACEQAYQRRGIPPREISSEPWRPANNRSARNATFVKYGWWAFGRGDRSAALQYGLRAARCLPWRLNSWRLLACALIKPMREMP